MPICLSCTLGPTLTMQPVYAICSRGSTSRWFSSRAQYWASKNLDSAVIRARDRTRISARLVSSLAEASSPTHDPCTFLHKTRTFLPRALGPGKSLDFWHTSLSEFPNEHSSRLRIVVSGVDEWSRAQNLVTPLLLEPFASESRKLNKTILKRWKDRPENDQGITLEYGACHSKNKYDPSVVRIPAGWFLSTNMQAQIIELPSPSVNSTSRTLTGQLDSIHPMLFKADIPIIFINTITTPLSSLLKYPLILKNPNAIILLTPKPTSPELALHIRTLLAKAGAEPVERHESDATPPSWGAKVLFVDPELVLQAIEVADPKDPRNIEVYERSFVDSNIGSITRAVTNNLEKSFKEIPSLKIKTVLTHIRCALDACKDSIRQAEWDLDTLCERVSELRGKVEEAKARVHGEVLGTDGLEVRKAVNEAEKEMKGVMDDLTWWRMVWRVDEIGQIVGNAVQRAWCKELKHKLILHTGRLSMLQNELTSSAKQLPMLLSSPVLQNDLLQLSSSPSYHLQTSSLITPLQTRQNQLISYPTTRLHLAGQNAVFGMLGGVVGGAGVAAYLINAGSGIAMISASEAGTAVGALMLCTLLGVRWAVGKWEKAKRGWWEDWSRVGEGLERDLEATLDRTMNEKVVIVADRAADGLNMLVQKRKAELDGVKEELEALEKQLSKWMPF